ncbi:unnamed protein product [Moneuplotes crassus]|uniref:Uncharacterized protein n=1 Tax=Euplotes crassus TaxID=5936 RepID=A0AAD1Y940_EUPCR|nr:unnamed protein product [Moneuplotes crassus]
MSKADFNKFYCSKIGIEFGLVLSPTTWRVPTLFISSPSKSVGVLGINRLGI